LPSSFRGLPYSFAHFEGGHAAQSEAWRGIVSAPLRTAVPTFVARATKVDRFVYRATIAPQAVVEPCRSGSLAEFAMERYSGFFCRGADARVFRAWHPPWRQSPVEVVIEEASLVTNQFPWFRQAELAGANVTQAIPEVWLGRPHRLGESGAGQRDPAGARSAFLDMP